MFEEVRWSAADTLSDTCLSVELADSLLRQRTKWIDINEPSDLMRVWGGRCQYCQLA